MTDAIATNKTVICNETHDSNATKDINKLESQNKSLNDDVSCEIINTIRLQENNRENATSKVNINSTLHIDNDNTKTGKCVNNSTDVCDEVQSKVGLSKNGDMILKYVYKNSDKTITDHKSKGHSKNSLVRKKRSLEVEPALDIKSVPVTIDYITAHDIKDREELVAPQYKSDGIIKKNKLANFNIETLHEDLNLPTNIGKKENYDKTKSSKLFKEDNTSNHRQEYGKNEEFDKNVPVSTENKSRESDDSNESIESNSHNSPYRKENKESENINESKSNENSDELIYSQKNRGEVGINTDSKYIPNDDDRKINYKPDEPTLYAKDLSQIKEIETSSESEVNAKYKSDKNNISKGDQAVDVNTPRSLQDVDLGDFSYERIHVNDKGRVEPAKDYHENYNSEEIPQTPNKSESQSDKTKSEPITVDIESSPEDDLSNEQLVKINDGEVKPVVELNSEDDSKEPSDENSSELQNSHLEKLVENTTSSEEDLSSSKEVNEKIVAVKENDGEKDNVKQQFERIPLDYNHDDKSQVHKETENKDESESPKSNQDEKINDGTLDSLTPKTDSYDDKLNFKFDDISIKLPEINLPDDILSYSRIGAPKQKKNKKKKKEFYHYEDDIDSEENQDEEKKGKTHDRYGFYNTDIDKDHESYKISNSPDNEEEDGDVDLYEKFVRERFGKKGSFGKRSEKLRSPERKATNPKLLKTIQTILKQTEKVRDEAEKSGDPNAGYLWTLEYGENH